MATKIFLGNPPSSIVEWIKNNRSTVVVKNMTGKIQLGDYSHNIELSNSNASYTIAPKHTQNIIPGTYQTTLTHESFDHHDAYPVELNGQSLEMLDFKTVGNSYTGSYTYSAGSTYEFLAYGAQPM